MEKEKQEYREIKPSLFKIDISHYAYYVIAYDAKHAIETANFSDKELESLKGITNLTNGFQGHIYIAPECLEKPKLVNKRVKKC